MLLVAPIRELDTFGSGAYGAPRGERKHKGIDFACYPGSLVMSFGSGIVTKLGYPYGDDLFFRYVEVTDTCERRLRYFYLNPFVSPGDKVTQETILGSAQSLQNRYKGITDHIHFEIMCGDAHLDPNEYYLRRMEGFEK